MFEMFPGLVHEIFYQGFINFVNQSIGILGDCFMLNIHW